MVQVVRESKSAGIEHHKRGRILSSFWGFSRSCLLHRFVKNECRIPLVVDSDRVLVDLAFFGLQGESSPRKPSALSSRPRLSRLAAALAGNGSSCSSGTRQALSDSGPSRGRIIAAQLVPFSSTMSPRTRHSAACRHSSWMRARWRRRISPWCLRGIRVT